MVVKVFVLVLVALLSGCTCASIQEDGAYGFVCKQRGIDNASSEAKASVEGEVREAFSRECEPDKGA